jgi:hypothetical protein
MAESEGITGKGRVTMTQIVRTTRRTQVNDGNEEPVETIHEREVDRVIREEDDTRGYDETRALRPWIRGLQNVTQRQFTLLREFDFRLSNSEARNRAASNEASLDRASFWVVWVTLMLVLGSALAIVLILILSSIVR